MSNSIAVIPTRSEHTITFKVAKALLPYGKSIPFSEPGVSEFHPMAKELMAIVGVNSTWIMGEEIMVTKDEGMRWATVKPKVMETIRRVQSES
jgi:hypothetical protein